MPYDAHSGLWPQVGESFFRDRIFIPQRQVGPHCVATTLAMMMAQTPDEFMAKMNTQNPATWSDALAPWQMQLAYCPTDVRKVKFYVDELIHLDDLFTISYYTTTDAGRILADPNERGWVTGSHVVLLHREYILDPASGQRVLAREHHGMECHTKRVFRVVPRGYPRCL